MAELSLYFDLCLFSNRVQGSGSLSYANRVCGVTFETEPDDHGRYPLFGAKYHFHLEGVVDVPEYLVYFPLLERLDINKCIGHVWK